MVIIERISIAYPGFSLVEVAIDGSQFFAVPGCDFRSRRSKVEDIMWKSVLAVGFLVAASLGFTVPCNAAQLIGIGGQCLDVQGDGTADGTPIIMFHCHGSGNQQWIFNNGVILGSSGKCLDVEGGGTADGTPIILYHCHSGPNQQWSVQ
jgi:hypothetical protein